MKSVNIGGFYCEQLNPNTKRAKQMKWLYEYSNTFNLQSAYKTCSYWKQKAFADIVDEMHDVRGFRLKVTSANSQFFSCAYVIQGDRLNKLEMYQLFLVYHTPQHTYLIEL